MSFWKKIIDAITGTERKTVRARDEDGKFIPDNPETPENEAWEEQE